MGAHRGWKIGWAVGFVLVLIGGGPSAGAQHISTDRFAALLPLVVNDPVVFVSDFEPHSQWNGDYRMIGEVTSLATVPIYDVVIGLRGIYQGALTTYFMPTMFPATLPGQINLFEFNLNIPYLQNAELFIEGWSLQGDTLYAAALVEDIVVTGCCGYIIVDAVITNTTTQTIWNVRAIPWTLTQGFQFDFYPIAPDLAPGESIEVEMEMYGVYDSSPVINVIAQGEVHP